MTINKRNLLHTALILLATTTAILLYKSYKDNKKSKEIQSSLNEENKLTELQLTEMLKKYDSVVYTYKNLENSFNEVAALNNKSNNSEAFKLNHPKSMELVSNQIANIKDSIKSLSQKLKNLEKVKTKFASHTIKVKANTNANPSKSFELTNIQARGVKFLKEQPNNKKTEIEQIRVCFTVDQNYNLARTDTEFYIQIVSPKNSIITSTSNTLVTENYTLKYTKKVDFFYDQQVTDVCNFIDIPKNRVSKGRYLVNIYSGGKKIGSTIFNNM